MADGDGRGGCEDGALLHRLIDVGLAQFVEHQAEESVRLLAEFLLDYECLLVFQGIEKSACHE